MTRLTGLVAVVTGASSGIGLALVRALAHEGAKLIVIGRDRVRLESLMRDEGVAATPCVLDLARPFERLPTALEGVAPDLLVHCAGAIVTGRMAQANGTDFDLQMNVNARGPWMLTRLLLAGLVERKGQVVFVNSTIARQTAPAGLGVYAASKCALAALADSLRNEVNELGVRVTTVYPGRTATPMQAALHAEEGRAWRPERLMAPEDVAATVLHVLLLPRTAEATDVSIRPFQKG